MLRHARAGDEGKPAADKQGDTLAQLFNETDGHQRLPACFRRKIGEAHHLNGDSSSGYFLLDK